MNKKRQTKTAFILEKLGEGALEASALFLALSSAGYGASRSKIEYKKEKIKKEIIDLLEKEEKTRYSKLIYKLKKEGLVEEKNKKGQKILVRTTRGREKFRELIDKERKSLPRINYSREKSNYPIIVIFDIPESKRGTRDWLRRALRELEFEMVQKSVWFGQSKIPGKFLADLDNLEISRYVEIFAVSKKGSLERVG